MYYIELSFHGIAQSACIRKTGICLQKWERKIYVANNAKELGVYKKNSSTRKWCERKTLKLNLHEDCNIGFFKFSGGSCFKNFYNSAAKSTALLEICRKWSLMKDQNWNLKSGEYSTIKSDWGFSEYEAEYEYEAYFRKLPKTKWTQAFGSIVCISIYLYVQFISFQLLHLHHHFRRYSCSPVTRVTSEK